jgi:hypothetical protein
VAGLLLSFDSTLTAEALKVRVVEGARRGGRSVAGIRLANAYESLRAAAEARGVPLCGNRVWATGGELITERERAAGTREVLATIGEPAYDLNARHGGRRVEFRGDNTDGKRAFVLGSGGTWSEVPTTDTTARLADGGTYLSASQLSHNADSGVILRGVAAGYEVVIIDGRTRTREVIATIPAVADYSGLSQTCLWWTDHCHAYTAVGSWTAPFASVAFGPPGDRVYIALGHNSGTTTVSGEYPCEQGDGCTVATGVSTTVTSGGSLYVVNIRGDRTPRIVGALGLAGLGRRLGGRR